MRKFLSLLLSLILLTVVTVSSAPCVIETAKHKTELKKDANTLSFEFSKSDSITKVNEYRIDNSIINFYFIRPEGVRNKINYRDLNFNGYRMISFYFPAFYDFKIDENSISKIAKDPGKYSLYIVSIN